MWGYFGLAAIVVAALAGFGWYEQKVGYDRRVAEEAPKIEARQQAVIQRTAEVTQLNQQKDQKAEKVEAHVQDAKVTVDRSFARVVAERDGLRDALDRVRADALSEGTAHSRLAEEAAATADSLGQCSARYSEVARERDDLVIQVDGLLDLLATDDVP